MYQKTQVYEILPKEALVQAIVEWQVIAYAAFAYPEQFQECAYEEANREIELLQVTLTRRMAAEGILWNMSPKL